MPLEVQVGWGDGSPQVLKRGARGCRTWVPLGGHESRPLVDLVRTAPGAPRGRDRLLCGHRGDRGGAHRARGPSQQLSPRQPFASARSACVSVSYPLIGHALHSTLPGAGSMPESCLTWGRNVVGVLATVPERRHGSQSCRAYYASDDGTVDREVRGPPSPVFAVTVYEPRPVPGVRDMVRVTAPVRASLHAS
jgi:hypothetical protein